VKWTIPEVLLPHPRKGRTVPDPGLPKTMAKKRKILVPSDIKKKEV
jgi:hypothetical protein